MKISDLGIIRASSKQMGDKYICGDRHHIQGYQITSFNGLNPDTIEFVRSIANTPDGMTWDQAYDEIFGTPDAPKFGKNLLTQ